MIKYTLHKKFPFVVIIILFMVSNGYSQNDTTKQEIYDDLSLKDLLNIKIVSVSKKSESLFDAPLSASVITKEDIRKAGCNSIMEALRLVPGIIVREQTNGNYDIHIRGMDNVPPNAPFEGNSTTTLVMIDNRPIYNYLKGGTFWETLPVDLNDVEKIEIVRGPAAALYGPNAVSGVINIITSQPLRNGLYLVTNAKQGSYNTHINNASIGYKSDNWSAIASGNYQHRDRTQTSYFEMYRDRYIDDPSFFVRLLADTVYNIKEMYPKPRLSMEKYAGNVFLNYQPSEKTKISLSSGIQHSLVQTVLTDNGFTPLSTVASDSRYADLKVNVNCITAQLSYNKGTQKTNFNPGNKYDFKTLDANVEYNFTRNKFSLKPGLSYRRAIYDDTRYSDTANKTGIFNARGEIITKSASLRGEYKLINNKLRLIAGVATNTFNYPDSTYISYQFAATYKANNKHLFRAVYSSSPRSSTIYDAYINQTIAFYQSGNKKFTRYAVVSNKNLKLLTANMLEIGYRGSINPAWSIDVDVFNIRSKNFNSLVSHAAYINMTGSDTLEILSLVPTNLPLILQQQGITISLNYNLKKIHVNPFVTLQRSRIKNYVPFFSTPDAPPSLLQPNPRIDNIYSGMGKTQAVTSTPDVFGGANFNYQFTSKVNGNMSLYYYSNQVYQNDANIVFNDGIRGIDYLKAKLIVNANVTFEPLKRLYISVSAKNILNDRSREFFRADDVPFMLLAGINYEF